jgi:hypothetical protein
MASAPDRPRTSQIASSFEVRDLQRRLADVATRSPPNALGHTSPNSHTPSGGHTPLHPEGWMPEIEMEPAFEPHDARDIPPEEIHLVLTIPIPLYAAPSNQTMPCMISHRIKWACLILYVFASLLCLTELRKGTLMDIRPSYDVLYLSLFKIDACKRKCDWQRADRAICSLANRAH